MPLQRSLRRRSDFAIFAAIEEHCLPDDGQAVAPEFLASAARSFIVNLDWQIVVVAACVTWAVVVLALRVYRLFREPTANFCGSGGCHGCPSNSPTKSSDLIQLDVPNRNPVSETFFQEMKKTSKDT